MGSIKKFDLSGEEIGVVSVEDALTECKASSQMIKDYIVAVRKNNRQWSANTKTRAEVSCSGKKPHAQKGLGRARQGSLASPHYKGGGVAFGPKPKFNMHTKINRKERRAVIRHLICEKIKSENLCILDHYGLDAPKTKSVANFFSKKKIKDKRVLVIGKNPLNEGNEANQDKQKNFFISMRNIPRKHYLMVDQINGYELALTKDVIVLSDAAESILAILGKGAK